MVRVSPGIVSPGHEVLSPEQWRRLGRARRKALPRASHGEWVAPADRPDPVAILEVQAATRVPELVAIRHGRMVASPFSYFRGAAAPMAWDLAHTPTTDIRVQACGDAHLLNFGMFAAPDRRLVFDVNDFDETLPASFEWDVKRLAASVAVAARDHGFARAATAAPRRAGRRPSYRTEIAPLRGHGVPEGLVLADRHRRGQQAVRRSPARAAVRRRHRTIDKARQRTSAGAFQKLCDRVDGEYRIRSAPPLIVRLPVERHERVREELRAAVALMSRPCRSTGARCSTDIGSPTSRARSSASDRSAPRRSSCC